MLLLLLPGPFWVTAGLSEFRVQTRLKIIDQLLAPFRESLKKLMDVTSEAGSKERLCIGFRSHHKYGRVVYPSEICEELMLGAFVRFLARHQLWPLPPAAEVKLTIDDLANKLATAPQGSLRIHEAIDHSECCPVANAKETIKKIVDDAEIELTEAQRRHLAKQAAKSGLSYN